MKSYDEKVFSLGTDFQSLRSMCKKKDILNIQNYFFNLTKFAHFMGNYKKPVALNVNGVLKNSAAAIFLNRPSLINKNHTSTCQACSWEFFFYLPVFCFIFRQFTYFIIYVWNYIFIPISF